MCFVDDPVGVVTGLDVKRATAGVRVMMPASRSAGYGANGPRSSAIVSYQARIYCVINTVSSWGTQATVIPSLGGMYESQH